MEVVERIRERNVNAYELIESLKQWQPYEANEIMCKRYETRGYLLGLVHAGFITKEEENQLFDYIGY